MLQRIEQKEIMTSWEARNKYRDKYFHFIITEKVDGCDNDLGYVLYTYDNKREMRGIPNEELKGKVYDASLGVAAEPYGIMGCERIEVYDNNN